MGNCGSDPTEDDDAESSNDHKPEHAVVTGLLQHQTPAKAPAADADEDYDGKSSSSDEDYDPFADHNTGNMGRAAPTIHQNVAIEVVTMLLMLTLCNA